jgi:glycogen operon protein
VAERGADVVAGRERVLERHPADHVSERGDRELLDRAYVVRDLVGRGLRVGDLEVDDRVDVDHEVVLGDHGLRREGDHLLPQVDQRLHPVHVGHDQGKARVEGALVAPQPLDDPGARLRHDPDPA